MEVYSDDGYPGGSFDRPEYRRMMGDIGAGGINCVIFKDNSRPGRNYPELGRLMEEYFPRLHPSAYKTSKGCKGFDRQSGGGAGADSGAGGRKSGG